MKLTFRYKGGAGSGHHGHSGRPGKQGGSLPGEGYNTQILIVRGMTGLQYKPGDTYTDEQGNEYTVDRTISSDRIQATPTGKTSDRAAAQARALSLSKMEQAVKREFGDEAKEVRQFGLGKRVDALFRKGSYAMMEEDIKAFAERHGYTIEMYQSDEGDAVSFVSKRGSRNDY